MSFREAPVLEREPHVSHKEQSTEKSGRERLKERKIYRAALAYGRFIHRFRWLVLALWVVMIAVSSVFMIRTTSLLGGGDTTIAGSQSVQVSTLLKQQFHQNNSEVLVVFQSTTTPVTAPAYQHEINALESELRAQPSVQSVTISPAGTDGKTSILVVESRAGVNLPVSELHQIVSQASGPAQTYLTGGPAISHEMTQTSTSDVEHADLMTLPIALLILMVVFGTLVAACMPLLLAVAAIPVAMAMLYPIALHTPISSFVLSVASIVGLGISIDYSLFIIRRFREELANGHSVAESIGWTLATAGEAILFSGLIVMIGFVALMMIGLSITTSVGIGGAFIVLAAVLGALTFLPAMLCVLGPRINSLRVPYLWRFTMHAETEEDGETSGHGKQEQFWRALALRVMKRPILTVVLVCTILAALSWPIFSLRIGSTNVNALPSSSEARQGMQVLDGQYPTFRDQTIDLIVQTKDHSNMMSATNLHNLESLTNWLRTQPRVVGVTSILHLPANPGSPALSSQQLTGLYTSGEYRHNPGLAQYVQQNVASGDMTLVKVSSNAALDSIEGNAQIDSLRGHVAQHAAGFSVLVGGDQASSLDFNRSLMDRFPTAVLFLLISTFILLTIMFRSLLIPLKAVIMNVISISAAYGVLVFIFQWGHFSNLLGFTSSGYVDSLIPIILFCILFGLSMDYEVFLLSRIREEWLRTKNNRQAVACGLEKTGSVITNAALLFLVVTVAFTFTSQLDTKEMGVGMTAAILVDATIIRSLLVPATMRLLGRWNWWFPGAKVPVEQPEMEPENVVKVVEAQAEEPEIVEASEAEMIEAPASEPALVKA
jgi:putative drug exporter of the RND superfamily